MKRPQAQEKRRAAESIPPLEAATGEKLELNLSLCDSSVMGPGKNPDDGKKKPDDDGKKKPDGASGATPEEPLDLSQMVFGKKPRGRDEPAGGPPAQRPARVPTTKEILAARDPANPDPDLEALRSQIAKDFGGTGFAMTDHSKLIPGGPPVTPKDRELMDQFVNQTFDPENWQELSRMMDNIQTYTSWSDAFGESCDKLGQRIRDEQSSRN